jgi:hypothetical protein
LDGQNWGWAISLKLLDPDPKKLKGENLNKIIERFKFIIININK